MTTLRCEGPKSSTRGGKPLGKTPLWRLAFAPGCVGGKIDEIFPCSWLRLLQRSLVIAGLGIVEQWPMVRQYVSKLAEAANGLLSQE